MQILMEAQVVQSPGVNESCWEDVDLEQGFVATRGFLIQSFLRRGRDVWVCEGDLGPFLSWPRVSSGDGVILRFSLGVWWFDPRSHLGSSGSHLQNKTNGKFLVPFDWV